MINYALSTYLDYSKKVTIPTHLPYSNQNNKYPLKYPKKKLRK